MKLFFILLILCLNLWSFAGTRKKVRERPVWNKLQEAPVKKGIWLQSVGLTGGVYNPSMHYWNEVSQIRNWDQKFDMASLMGANLEIGLGSWFVVRGEVGYGSMKARYTNVPEALGGGTQQKTLQLLPLSGMMLVNLSRGTMIRPYVGGGLGNIMVNSLNEQMGSSDPLKNVSGKSSAMDVMAYAVGGFDYPVGDFLSVGTEIRQAFGKYVDNDKGTTGVLAPQYISLNGLQVMFRVNYTFGN